MKSYINLNDLIIYLRKKTRTDLSTNNDLTHTKKYLRTNFDNDVKEGILEYLKNKNITSDLELLENHSNIVED